MARAIFLAIFSLAAVTPAFAGEEPASAAPLLGWWEQTVPDGTVRLHFEADTVTFLSPRSPLTAAVRYGEAAIPH